MKVFKFGGASVKSADAVKNIAGILTHYKNEQVVTVISAMGKTTNALERIVNAHFNKSSNASLLLEEIKKYHTDIIEELFDAKHKVIDEVTNFFVEVAWTLEEEPRSYDFLYDQIVSVGELVSTCIVSNYLESTGHKNKWLDVRDVIQTDNSYRSAKVDFTITESMAKRKIPSLFAGNNLIITQGFIGNTSENYTTTLGREGSDYTAAILAYCLNAESVSIWKDVPGVLSADPRYFEHTQKLNQISYLDAIEMTYFGATVIHPKTIKPLENKKIPLYVKSFIEPRADGTLIGHGLTTTPFIPNLILKEEQVLITISATDFSFIAEDNLSDIFEIFAMHKTKINMMQNSAVSFSVCIDFEEHRFENLLAALKVNYQVRYNKSLLLYTVRHYTSDSINQLMNKNELMLEQRSRHTVQLVMRKLN